MMVDGANEEEDTGIPRDSEPMSDEDEIQLEEDDVIQPLLVSFVVSFAKY